MRFVGVTSTEIVDIVVLLYLQGRDAHVFGGDVEGGCFCPRALGTSRRASYSVGIDKCVEARLERLCRGR